MPQLSLRTQRLVVGSCCLVTGLAQGAFEFRRGCSPLFPSLWPDPWTEVLWLCFCGLTWKLVLSPPAHCPRSQVAQPWGLPRLRGPGAVWQHPEL